jgi:hypothetical protein
MYPFYRYIRQGLVFALFFVAIGAWSQSSIPDPQWIKTYPDLHYISYTSNKNQLAITADGAILHNGIKFTLLGDTLLRVGTPTGTTTDGGIISFYFEINYLPPLDSRRFYSRYGYQKVSSTGQLVFKHDLYSGYGPGSATSMDFSEIKKILGTPDNGFLILNETGRLTAYDANGNERWSKTMTSPASSVPTNPVTSANDIQVRTETVMNTAGGGYLVGGYVPGVVGDPFNSDNPSLGWVAKLNEQGEQQWVKLLNTLQASSFNLVRSVYAITDLCPAANGSGYVLVGSGYAYSSPVQAPPRTILLEINADGSLNRGRAFDKVDPTPAFVTRYVDGGDQTYYVLGSTAIGVPNFDYRILKISTLPGTPFLDQSTLLPIVAQRTFSLSTTKIERLTDIEVAPDGGLVFSGTTGLIKLVTERQSGGALTLTTPTYNCQTGAIVFNTRGGDGSPITYTAPGISRTSLLANTGTVEQELRNDPKPILIQATQNGQTSSLLFDFGTYCQNPQTPPNGGPLTLTAPTYNCETGAIRFNTTGGDGSSIEFAAAGITGWTTDPNQFVDRESRTVDDVQPFTLMARQGGVVVQYVWNLKAACGRARRGVAETGGGLQVRVLGNPVQHQWLTIEVSGVTGQALQVSVLDLQGHVLHQDRVEQANAVERVNVPVNLAQGMCILQVSTPAQRRLVRLVRP